MKNKPAEKLNNKGTKEQSFASLLCFFVVQNCLRNFQ
jgi:hypothetical protein